MNPHEFGQRPFAAGSLIGVRSFRVTTEGVLTGCVHRSAWQPGINEAECQSIPQTFAQVGMAAAVAGANLAWSMQTLGAAVSGRVLLAKRPKPPPAPPAHQVGTLNCSCGFYAYFDEGHNPHHEPCNVLGIIEGFGACTVGARGFRCSKARILALISEPRWQYGRTLDNVNAARANYPDVPIFTSLAAALAEFPLTPVEVPEPCREVVPQGIVNALTGSSVTYTMKVDMSGISRALADAINRAYRYGPPKVTGILEPETPRERALSRRRNRNTGPADQRGIDGHFRRRAQR